MKRVISAFLLIALLLLSGCAVLESGIAETLKGWSFQYNEGTEDYSVFFGLLNKGDRYISANVNVDIRIVNDSDEEVYAATKSVNKDDFGYYTSKAAGEQYLAEIRIPESDIAPGKSSSGTVYLTVYINDVIRFDEVNCSALYCLPVMDVQLVSGPFPVEIDVKSYDGSVESTFQIDGVSYVYEKDLTPQLRITINGEKTYGASKSHFDVISYKLYDSEGYMAASGNIYPGSIGCGDKFKDDSVIIYDVTPGETYRLDLDEYEW